MKENLTPLQTELLARADAIFASVSTAVSKATNFASEQIPDIALQYVAYGRAYLTTYVILSIVGIIGSVIVIKKTYFEDAFIEFGRFMLCFGSVLVFVASVVLMLTNINTFMMVWFAPKVWLITELVHLVK